MVTNKNLLYDLNDCHGTSSSPSAHASHSQLLPGLREVDHQTSLLSSRSCTYTRVWYNYIHRSFHSVWGFVSGDSFKSGLKHILVGSALSLCGFSQDQS